MRAVTTDTCRLLPGTWVQSTFTVTRTFLASRTPAPSTKLTAGCPAWTTLSSLIVEGIYPKYQQVIPKDADKEVTIKREPFMHALRKAFYLTSDETKTVSLKFSPGTCLIEARSPDKGQAAVTLEVEYNGEEVTIGFNPQYLQDALKVLAADTVRLDLKDGNKPGTLREGQDFLYVLMPVNPKD